MGTSLVPEVEVDFLTGGEVWKLRKAFRRGGAELTLWEAWEASRFIVFSGLIGMLVAHQLTNDLLFWVLPVLLPMIFAPLIISLSSRQVAPNPEADARRRLFTTPEELHVPRILSLHDEILARWTGLEPSSYDVTVPDGLELSRG